jgi:hypothetical protein
MIFSIDQFTSDEDDEMSGNNGFSSCDLSWYYHEFYFVFPVSIHLAPNTSLSDLDDTSNNNHTK